MIAFLVGNQLPRTVISVSGGRQSPRAVVVSSISRSIQRWPRFKGSTTETKVRHRGKYEERTQHYNETSVSRHDSHGNGLVCANPITVTHLAIF